MHVFRVVKETNRVLKDDVKIATVDDEVISRNASLETLLIIPCWVAQLSGKCQRQQQQQTQKLQRDDAREFD